MRPLLPALAAVLALAAGCAGSDVVTRQPVSITDVRPGPTPLSLVLTVASCNGAPRSTVAESDAEVRVTVTARVGGESANACADGVQVEMQRPLGSRSLIDGAVNRTLRAPGLRQPVNR